MSRARLARRRCAAAARPAASRPARRVLLAAAVTALLAAPLGAQDSTAAPPALAGLRASGLRPGSWTYAATVTREGASIELARRTLTIAPAMHEGVAAWLLLDRTSARGQTMTDSL